MFLLQNFCCFWRNPSRLAMRAKHSPVIHEKNLQNHGEPLIPWSFSKCGLQIPILQYLPIYLISNRSSGPMDWLNSVHCPKLCLQLNSTTWTLSEFPQAFMSTILTSSGQIWVVLLRFKHLTIWSPAAVSAMKDSGVPAHENGSSYQPKTVPNFHLPIILMTLLSELSFPPGNEEKHWVKPPLADSTNTRRFQASPRAKACMVPKESWG